MSLVSATYDRWEQQHPGFVELSQRLSRYSCESVLEGLATLQIYPENAPQTLRLQLFANIAVCSCKAGGARATLKDLERMFTNTALGAYEIIEQQDPFANAFVEEVGFLGLPYRCLPGIHEGPLFDFRQLLKALFMSYEPMFDAQALSELGEIVRWSLTLSDAILDRAGLSAVTWCPDGHRKTLSLSRGKNLAELCWFSDEELAAYGRPFGLSRETLLTLVVKPDEGPLNLGEGPLHRGPLVPTRGGYLVAMPAALWSAARHQIVSRVIAAGKGPELSDRLAAATLDTMEARFSHFEEIEEGTPVLPNGCYGIELEVDVYQRVLVIAACDTLENWDTGRSCGDRSGPLPEELTGAINEWIETIQVGLPGVHVMVCLCSVGVGRFGSIWGSLPQGQPGTVKNVCCRAEELDLVMWMEDGNLNAVILLQRHLALTREYNQVHYSCYLDLYAQYRIHRSFYFSDKGTPGMLVIPCDLSLAVRQQYDQRYNPQWVPYYAEPRVFVHVHRLRANEPVYFLTERIDDRVALWVGSGKEGTWWITPESIFGDAFLYKTLITALTYWNSCLQDELRAGWPFCIETAFTSSALAYEELVPDPIEEAVQIRWQATPFRRLQVLVGRNFRRDAMDFGNRAELELVGSIVDQSGCFSPAQLAVLNRYLAQASRDPFRKMFLSEFVMANDLLDPTDLPEARLLSVDHLELALEGVGAHFLENIPLKIRQVSGAQASAILNEAVAYLYSRAQTMLADQHPVQCLNYLIEQNESLIEQQAHLEHYGHFELACYPGLTERATEQAKRNSDLAGAAVTNRFLLEWVGACNACRGELALVDDVYDELCAIVSKMIEFGLDSDLVQYGIAELEVEQLPSGRLAVNRKGYQHSRQQFSVTFQAQQLQSAARKEEQEAASGGFARLLAVFPAEFGYRLEDLISAFDALNGLMPPYSSIGNASRRECLHQIEQQGLSPELAARILEDYTQPRRKELLKPPKPFRAENAYPWRMQRSLSYLRRPLSQIGDQIFWGRRNLAFSPKFLALQIFEGRYTARSGELQSEIGKLSQIRGKQFENLVPTELARQKHLRVEGQVKRINGLPLEGPKGTLGEIDCLCIDLRHREIWVLECKAYSRARAPHEMRQELDRLFAPGNHVDKHAKRVEWVNQHRRETLEHFGLQAGKKSWRVRARILTEEAVFAPHLQRSAIEVEGWQKFRQRMLKGLPDA